jgi:hypothetical protein
MFCAHSQKYLARRTDTAEADATFDEYDQKQESDATRGPSETDLGDSVGDTCAPVHPVLPVLGMD